MDLKYDWGGLDEGISSTYESGGLSPTIIYHSLLRVFCPETFNLRVPPLPSVIIWLNVQQRIISIACGPSSRLWSSLTCLNAGTKKKKIK